MRIVNANEAPAKPAPITLTTRIAGALSKVKPAKMSTLAQLIAEGAAVKLELQSLDAPNARKLSGKAFADEAVSLPGASKTERDALLEVITRPENEPLAAALRVLIRRMMEPGVSGPWRKIRSHFHQEADNVLARLRVTQASAFAAAAVIAARDHPEAFGKATSSTAFDARVKELGAKLADIQRRIGAEWQRSDVTMSPSTDDNKRRSLIRLTIDCTDGAVCVGPDMGEQAVNWWLSHSMPKAA